MRLFKAVVLGGIVLGPALVMTQAQQPAGGRAETAPSASLAPPPDAPPPHPVAPGPYAVSVIAEPTLMTHTVYRPADLSPFVGTRRLPIIAWGNGACSNAGLLFQTFLTQIASHGFVAIASGPKDAPLPAFASQVPGQSTSTPPEVKVPLNTMVWAFWLMLMKPPGPTILSPNRLTLTLQCSSTSAKDRNASSRPPPS